MKMLRRIPLLFLSFFVSACALSGRVETELKDTYPAREAPTEYQSPREALELFIKEIRARGLVLKAKQNRLAEAEKDFLSAAAVLYREQKSISERLSAENQVEILPGRSYSFDLESFCVNAGKERPLQGDGFRVGPLKGKAAAWLPKILENYSSKGLPQSRAQVLIWALLSDARFDELSDEQQSDLLKIDPNARIKFGNRRLENEAQNLLDGLIPDEMRGFRNQLESYRSLLLDASRSYEEVSSLLAPHPARDKPIDLGWVKAKEGFLIRVTSIEGYSSVRVEIYMPLGPDPIFRPSKNVALPAQGQRLALSASVLGSLQQDYRDVTDALINWKAGRRLSKEEQDLIRKHPMDAYHVFRNARIAVESAREHFPGESLHNTRGDAFRHYVWSALNVRDLDSEERAREFLEAHEKIEDQPAIEVEMDSHNNEQGIAAARKLGDDITLDALEAEAMKALGEGKLKVLRK